MSFRTWLLTSTSIGFLALAPIGAADAQDAQLTAAYQAYVTAQASGDAAAIETARTALNEQCIAAGFASFEDCLAALQAQTGAQAAPSSEEAAPPAEEAPPPPPEEAPPPPPSEEAPPPPPPAEEAPPPPASEEAPPPPPASEEAPPPPAPSEEVAPPPASEQAAPPPSSEAAPPASTEAAPSAEAGADLQAQLQAAVDLYNEGVAELDSGNADGQAKVDQALATITSICTAAGYPDNASCLAEFGLELQPLPSAPAQQPAASSEPPASSEQPATSEEPVVGEEQPVTEEATEALPADVAPEEAAPVLDSAKDQETAAQEGQTSSEPPPPASEEPPPAPPPADDKQAQAELQPPPPEELSTQTEQGQQIDVGSITLTPPPDNPDVKVIQGGNDNRNNNGFIFQIGINIFINNPEQERDRYYDRNEDEIYYEQLSRGRIRETVVKPNGVKIVTVRNRNGDILKRSKILPNGREIILASFDDRNDDFLLEWRDPGEDLPPLRLTIPISDYILDADEADEDEIEFFLDQPPVEQVRRIYSIDEVKRSARIRDSVRRLEVGGLTFDSGKATIARDQVSELSAVAKAMQRLLDKNPGEVFLIEGHTDAVGSDESNLVLSDKRAATVATVLTEFYDIPAENLVTQGYGERYLKVKTQEAEELNRRVTIKRITALVSYES
ncbi:MAG TPA: OmpA family protein [Devosia sp.]|nr:OmpA family protein [Devosia sp.]